MKIIEIKGCYDCIALFPYKRKWYSETKMCCNLGGDVDGEYEGLYPLNCPLIEDNVLLKLKK